MDKDAHIAYQDILNSPLSLRACKKAGIKPNEFNATSFKEIEALIRDRDKVK